MRLLDVLGGAGTAKVGLTDRLRAREWCQTALKTPTPVGSTRRRVRAGFTSQGRTLVRRQAPNSDIRLGRGNPRRGRASKHNAPRHPASDTLDPRRRAPRHTGRLRVCTWPRRRQLGSRTPQDKSRQRMTHRRTVHTSKPRESYRTARPPCTWRGRRKGSYLRNRGPPHSGRTHRWQHQCISLVRGRQSLRIRRKTAHYHTRLDLLLGRCSRARQKDPADTLTQTDRRRPRVFSKVVASFPHLEVDFGET